MLLPRVSKRRAAGSIAAAAAIGLAIALTACTVQGATEVTSVTKVTDTPTVPRGPGAVTQPVPGATSTPDPTTWSTVVAPTGFTVVVVTAVSPGTDPELDAAVEAVRSRAGSATVDTVTVPLGGATGSGDPFMDVLADSPDLVVVLGPELLDAADRSSASNLGQQFLIMGAQLPEPTANVTAVVWEGASARRADEPRAVPNGMPEVAQRAGDAFQAGVAALLQDTTGGVLVLP